MSLGVVIPSPISDAAGHKARRYCAGAVRGAGEHHPRLLLCRHALAPRRSQGARPGPCITAAELSLPSLTWIDQDASGRSESIPGQSPGGRLSVRPRLQWPCTGARHAFRPADCRLVTMRPLACIGAGASRPVLGRPGARRGEGTGI